MTSSGSSLQHVMQSSLFNYLLYLPHNLKARKWPLVVFLHGAGEMAKSKALDEIHKIKKHGIPKVVETLPITEERDTLFPFIAVSPQAGYPRGYGWDAVMVKKLVDSVLTEYGANVDQERLYLTGISMGGYGTWAVASEFPGVFAAIIPVSFTLDLKSKHRSEKRGKRIRNENEICGGCSPEAAPALRNTPIWNFHGKKDSIIPISQSEALKKQGATELKYTVYPDADHDSWTITYENPEIYEWLLEHKIKIL